MSLKVFFDGNINLKIENKKIALDPEMPTDADLIFISHAHLDHSTNIDNVAPKICSVATRDLIQYRKNTEMINIISLEAFCINGVYFKLLDSGHIIGSRSLLIETKNKRIFYTGDVCDKHRFYLKAAEIPRSDIMIVESTFGIPEYQFPSVMDVIERSTEWIREQLESGYSVALFGYPLGKAQIISKIVENFNLPIIVHDKIFDINEICKRHGFTMNTYLQYSKSLDILEKEQFIGIFPSSSRYINFLNIRQSKIPIKKAAFSGWAINPKYKDELGVDEAFPLSDHADFNGLIKIVKQSSPEKVYTVHGFATGFAKILRERFGFDAQPLTESI